MLGSTSGTAGAAFAQLSSDIAVASERDQAVFDSTARSAAGAYTGLEAGLRWPR